MNHLDDWVSAEFQNLAEVLYDYDHNLALEMVPREEWPNLVDQSKVFRVVDTHRNKIVMYFDSLVSPQQILGRIWSMDQKHNKVVDNLDAENRAAQALMLKKHQNELDEQRDFALFIARNTKSRWIHEGIIRDEHFRNLGSVRKHIT
jgi:hypothetical protein